MSDELLLCTDCKHWFDEALSDDECPVCWLSGREGNTLPTETTDPDEWELDGFGHAIEPKSDE